LNGDGRGDAIVGALGASGTAPDGAPADGEGAPLKGAGRAYAFDGATGRLLHALASPNAQEWGCFGVCVSGVEDVNGDGLGDLIVGAVWESPRSSPPHAGRAYVFDGKTGRLLRALASPNEQENGEFGNSVAGVPDVNGDGRGEILVGAYRESLPRSPAGAGRAYVFDGATGKLLQTLCSPNEERGGNFGVCASGAPDVNGDGRGDVVVGAWGETPSSGLLNAGRAYVFDGATGRLLHTLTSPNRNHERGGFCFSASGVGDLNRDGRGDIVVGAVWDTPAAGFRKAGAAYVFDGATGQLLHTLTSPNREPDRGGFGYSVAGIAGVREDGRTGLIAGATFRDPVTERRNPPRAYIFDGMTGDLLHRFEGQGQ
jgi:glycosylphosphatidylinositol phospholipase D